MTGTVRFEQKLNAKLGDFELIHAFNDFTIHIKTKLYSI